MMEDTPSRSASIVTVFPHSDKFRALPQKRPFALEGRKDRHAPKRRFLNGAVNPPSLFADRASPARADRLIEQRTGQSVCDAHYRDILEEDQAGECTIAYRLSDDFPVVAIKKRTFDQPHKGSLSPTCHENICNLLEFCYKDESTVWLVYECMTVSLSEIQACPISLQEYELAAIITEVYA